MGWHSQLAKKGLPELCGAAVYGAISGAASSGSAVYGAICGAVLGVITHISKKMIKHTVRRLIQKYSAEDYLTTRIGTVIEDIRDYHSPSPVTV